MSDGFELSLKNKVVRMYLWIIIPAAIISILLIWFTESPNKLPSIITIAAWLIFFIWLYFYKRKKKKDQFVTNDWAGERK